MKKLLFILSFFPLFANALTPVFTCGFECGVFVSGTHFVNSSNASINTNASFVNNGARSLKVNPTAATGAAAIVAGQLPATFIYVMRFYVSYSSLPTANVCVGGTNNTNQPGAYFKSSDSKIYAGMSGSLGATGVSITSGTWYRIDIKVNATSNPWTVDVQVNGVSCSQFTNAVAGAGPTALVLGEVVTNSSFDAYYDDVLISQTSADYPIGAGYVNHFTFTSDGTHNVAGANDFERGTLGTDILNATTDAYLLVDDVPLESAVVTDDYINAIAPPNATDYVEVKFGPATGISTPTTGPRAVEVIVATHQAATTVGSYKLNLNDNGTVGLIKEQAAVAGVVTLQYATKQFATAPSTSGAWTHTLFNNLRVRFYSSDAAPDQYFDCGMIEAEFATVSGSTNKPKFLIHKP